MGTQRAGTDRPDGRPATPGLRPGADRRRPRRPRPGATVVLVGAPASADVLPVTTTADGGAGSLREAVAQASANATADEIVLEPGATYVLDDCVAGRPRPHGGPTSSPSPATVPPSTRPAPASGCWRPRATSSSPTSPSPAATSPAAWAAASRPTPTRSPPCARPSPATGPAPAGAIAAIRVTLVASTVSANTAGSGGGGVWADQTITATSSTISGNTAAAGGGGLTVVNTSATLLFSTVVDNTAPTGANVQLQAGSDELVSFGSVVALPGGGDDCDLSPGVATTSQGSNLSSDASCGFGAGPGDRAAAGDPGLGPLAANGGPTETRLPLAGQPAARRRRLRRRPRGRHLGPARRPPTPGRGLRHRVGGGRGRRARRPRPPPRPSHLRPRPPHPSAADATFTG